MPLQARKLDLLPRTHHSQAVSSLLYEPSSRSLALMLPDSSFLLYPSLSPTPPPTPILPLSSAACFLRLLPAPARVLFITAAPHSSAIHLRAWIHSRASFTPARLSFKRDLDRSTLALDLPHGLSVRLAGTVNVLVINSLAANQIWVMSVRMIEGGIVRFTKCAVINCTLPIYSIGLSMTFLLLGEVGGVRVFPLRPLIKGKLRQGISQEVGSTLNLCDSKLPNGVVVSVRRGKKCLSSGEPHGARIHRYNAESAGRDTADNVPGRHKTAKLWQNSDDRHSIFIVIKCDEVPKAQISMGALASVKAVTIRELSQKTFLILDSVGDVHHLNLHNTVRASQVSRCSFVNPKDAEICRLSYTMKVQMLAVLPDFTNKTSVIWISDGGYSVHMVSIVDMEYPANESEKHKSEEKAMQISVMQAIFTSDKVQDVVPLSATAVLVLGKGNIFSYAMA